MVQNAIGGENVTTTVEGRERYPVNVRYMRDFRSDLDALARVPVPASEGQAPGPLSQLATIKVASGPAMVRNEDGLLTGYVYVDVAGRDLAGYVDEASRRVREGLRLPPGYAVLWSGQYEAMTRVRERLAVRGSRSPLLIVLLLLYLSTRSVVKTAIVALAVPFSAIGAVWYLYLLGYNMSVGRLGWADRPPGRRRGDGRLHAALPRSRLRAGEAGGPPALARGPAGRDRGGRGQAPPAEVHDGGHDLRGLHSDHVGDRDRLGRDGSASPPRWWAASSPRSCSSSSSTRPSTKCGSGTSK